MAGVTRIFDGPMDEDVMRSHQTQKFTLNPSACSCGGFLFARQAPSGGGYAGFVTGQRTKMAGKVL